MPAQLILQQECRTERSRREREDPLFFELNNGYQDRLSHKWITIGKSRRCSYRRIHRTWGNDKIGGLGWKTIELGEVIQSEQSSCGCRSVDMTPMAVEFRGITFRQLSAVHANASRRCMKEKWLSTNDVSTKGLKKPLTSETVTLYDKLLHYQAIYREGRRC